MAEQKGIGAAENLERDPIDAVDAGLGHLLREGHRALTRSLQTQIAVHGVSMGQWFFLRALWEQDGLTQRELSQRVGMMEPTTVTAINSMERRGFVRRVRNPHDRRKVNVFLTPKGLALKDVLIPCAVDVARSAVQGVASPDLANAARVLRQVLANLEGHATPASNGGLQIVTEEFE